MAWAPSDGKAPPEWLTNANVFVLTVIVTEKTNILLRYLHWRWEKKVRAPWIGSHVDAVLM